MQYIKARYLKEGNPTGREYTFSADIPVGIGDKVSIGSATAIVTQVDVPEKEIAPFKDRLKKIDGNMRIAGSHFDFLMEADKDLDPGVSKFFTCPACGGKARATKVRENGHLHASCENCGIRIIQ